MTLNQSFFTPSTKTTEPEMPESDNLRILVVGPELIAHALSSLLSSQTDMEVLPPISDLKQTVEFVMRMKKKQSPVHAVLMDWSGNHELQLKTLSALSRQDQRCLVVVPGGDRLELEQIKNAGACGYLPTNFSPLSMATAIRSVAGAKQETYFPDIPVDQQVSRYDTNDSVSRQCVFHSDRVQAFAKEIQWTLDEKDMYFFRNFTRETDEIAAELHCQPGAVRYAFSQRIYEFLRHLTRRPINKRFIAFQALLEYGILDYVPVMEMEPGSE